MKCITKTVLVQYACHGFELQAKQLQRPTSPRFPRSTSQLGKREKIVSSQPQPKKTGPSKGKEDYHSPLTTLGQCQHYCLPIHYSGSTPTLLPLPLLPPPSPPSPFFSEELSPLYPPPLFSSSGSSEEAFSGKNS